MKKKKMLLLSLVAVFSMFLLNSNVSAMTCNALPGVEIDSSIPNITSIILKVIWIAVPVILVIFGSMDLLKGVIAQKEDEIKKGQQTFIKRLIAGALVFFVFAIVQLVITAVAKSSVSNEGDLVNCACKFIHGPDSGRCVAETAEDGE